MNIESDDKLKEINTKTYTCYFFDDKTKIEDFDFDNILSDENHMKIFQSIKFQRNL